MKSRKHAAEKVKNVLHNFVSGFFATMGGCAMIGQSMINITSGARRRLSGIVAALCLLFFIIFASSLIEMIPVAALVGVMFMVVISTFAWSSLRVMHKIPLSDAFVIVLVSAVTVFFDLAIAVLTGVVVSALVYAWKNAHHITAVTNIENKVKTYHLYGPIFFGSVQSFRDLFHPKDDPDEIIINFDHSRVWDHSGIEALKKLSERYKSLGKLIKYRCLSYDCANMLEKSGCIVERDQNKDPHYEIIMDRK